MQISSLASMDSAFTLHTDKCKSPLDALWKVEVRHPFGSFGAPQNMWTHHYLSFFVL